MTSTWMYYRHLDLWLQGWCAFLVVLFVVTLGMMLLQSRKTRLAMDAAARALGTFQARSEDERRFGRPIEVFEQIREAAERPNPAHADWWKRVHESAEVYDSPEERRGYFLTRPAAEIITLDEVTRAFPARAYRAVPGVLTSLGLLGTFVALLLGLNGLAMDPATGTVTGLDNLISNLSGKFLTSIMALSLSVVFLVVEMTWCQPRLHKAHHRMLRSIEDALPQLTSARILLDIQRESVKQSRSLGNISSDVVGKFAELFRGDLAPLFVQGLSASMANQLQAEMGPTLVELRETMGTLTTTVSRLEQNKQESMLDEIRGLTESLERSLRETLGDMGRQFQSALTGSTQEEFGQLASVIRSSAASVEQMNTTFSLLQNALQSVVDEAKRSTTEQMAAGSEQTRRLNALVEGLIAKLNQTANENYAQMSGTLTSVVAELSDRVTRLSEDLVRTVTETAERSQSAATSTMREASSFSAQTQEQISRLIAAVEDKSDRLDRAGETLLSAQGLLQMTLDQNHKALQALGAAANEVRTYTSNLAGIQRQIDDGQKAQAQVATLSRESVAQLVEAADRHRHFLDEYRATFEKYREVFDGLDERIGGVLQTLLDGLQKYTRAVESNFKAIVESANDVMPRMAGVLKSSTDEIREHLDELSDVLEKSTSRLAVARRA